MSLLWAASFTYTHGGLEPLLFVLENFKGGQVRKLLRVYRMLFNFQSTPLRILLRKLRDSSNELFTRKCSYR